MRRLSLLFAAVILAMAMPLGHAQPVKDHKASGTVTKIDRSKSRLTIAHGPVESLKWPAMTMSFIVKDKALLDKVQQGAKVQFSFLESGRDYVVTEIK